MDSSVVESAVKIVVAVAAFGTLLATLSKDHHPLTPVERLSSLIDKLPVGATRDALVEHRDHAASQWVLRQRAPKFPGLRWLAIGISSASMTIAIAWLIIALASPTTWVTFALYGAALVLAIGAQIPARIRDRARRDWMRQEAQWRGMSFPDKASKVVK